MFTVSPPACCNDESSGKFSGIHLIWRTFRVDSEIWGFSQILGEVDPSLMGWVVLSPRFWTPGSFSVKMVHMTFYPNYLLCMDSWKKRHDVSSDISSFHSIEAHKQDGLYHCTVRASNSTVCKVCGYHSIHLVPQILKTKWFVPQMDLAGKPWFHRLVEAKSREGQKLRRRWLNGDSNFVWFHFGRAAMQHGICVWKKTHDQLWL